MVIANSDSTSTLMSLDDDNYYKADQYSSSSSSNNGVPPLGVSPTSVIITNYHHNIRTPVFNNARSTRLQLPIGRNNSSTDYKSKHVSSPQYLSLPYSMSVDKYLSLIPAVVERCSEVLSPQRKNAVHCYTIKSTERFVYVAQGEIAHAVPSQADILLSDRATTCHILALHSSFINGTNSISPLATLTHLDAAEMYESSVRDAVVQHYKYHCQNFGTASAASIDLRIHIVGGFCDNKEASVSISNWLLHLLADLADEYAGLSMNFIVETCAITCLNHNYNENSPVGRGLAINVHTGDVHLARCSLKATGPASVLRSVRLWSTQHNHDDDDRPLVCIHSHLNNSTGTHNGITVTPFYFCPFESLDTLLSLSDELLLLYTSTSPDCEEEDFAQSVRSTLKYMSTHSYNKVFPHLKPLHYKRIGNSNKWKQV